MPRVTFAEYAEGALRTEAPWTEEQAVRLQKVSRILHAVLGLQDEIGEVAKVIKAHIYYGKPLDFANLGEEGGDLLWYWNLFVDSINEVPGAVALHNLEKLRRRYPAQFTEEAAQARADKENPQLRHEYR